MQTKAWVRRTRGLVRREHTSKLWRSTRNKSHTDRPFVTSSSERKKRPRQNSSQYHDKERRDENASGHHHKSVALASPFTPLPRTQNTLEARSREGRPFVECHHWLGHGHASKKCKIIYRQALYSRPYPYTRRATKTTSQPRDGLLDTTRQERTRWYCIIVSSLTAHLPHKATRSSTLNSPRECRFFVASVMMYK